MKLVDCWNWPDGERHMLEWIADPKNRMILNGRPSYQGKKQMAALDLCPLGRRRMFVDIGGHIGLWAFNMGHWFKQVEAFEPVPEHRECFEANVMGKVPAKVTMHPFALGDHPGMVSIRVDPSSTGGSHISGRGEIEMRRLDEFTLSNVDLIKVDCEGYEEFVLRGAQKTINEWHPAIVVEQKRDMALRFNLKKLGALTYLKELGYETVNEISGDYFLVHKG